MKAKVFLGALLAGLLGFGSVQAQNTYTPVTNIAEVEAGGTFLIVNAAKTKALSAKQNNNNRSEADFDENNVTVATTRGEELPCHIVIAKTDNGYTMKDNLLNGYLAFTTTETSLTKATNYLRTLSEPSYWDITLGENGVVIFTSKTDNSYTIRYNSNNKIFSCYTTGQADVMLYKYTGQGGDTPEPPVPQSATYAEVTDATTLQAGDRILIAGIELGMPPYTNAAMTTVATSTNRLKGAVITVGEDGNITTETAVDSEEKPCEWTLVANPAGEGFALKAGDIYLQGVTNGAELVVGENPAYYTFTTPSSNNDPGVDIVTVGEEQKYIRVNFAFSSGAVTFQLSMDNSGMANPHVYRNTSGGDTPEVVVPEGDIVLAENFTNCKGTDWSNSNATNITDVLDNYLDITGCTGENVYESVGAVKLGAGKKAGILTFPAQDLSYDNGVYYVAFKAMAWSKKNQNILLIAGGDTVTVSELDNSGNYDNAMKEYAFKFENGTNATVISFSAEKTNDNQYFLDSIRIYQKLPADMPILTALQEVSMNYTQGTSASVTVNVKGRNLTQAVAVAVSGEGFTVAPATLAAADVMAEAGADFTVTYDGSGEEGAEATVTLTSGTATATVKVTANRLITYATLFDLCEDMYENVLTENYDKNEIFVVTGDLVVTHKDSYNNRVYLQDIVMNDEEGASIMVFKAKDYGYADLQVGDVIGGLKGTLTAYKNLFEVNPKEKMVAKSHGHEVTVLDVEMSEINTVYDELSVFLQSALVRVKNVSFNEADGEIPFTSGAHLTLTAEDEETIDFYCTFNDADYLTAEEAVMIPEGQLTVTGIITQFEETMQLTARNLADIVAYEPGPGEDTTAISRNAAVAFELYPNPANKHFTVKVNEKAKVAVYNVTGVCVYEGVLNRGQNEMKLENAGVYFVRLSVGERTTVKRIVVR